MQCRVHESFQKQPRGPDLSIVPYDVPVFRPMGATSKVGFGFVVERADRAL
jgi:hypothetical protein